MSFIIFFLAFTGALMIIGYIYVYGWLMVAKIVIATSLIYTAGTLYRLRDKAHGSCNRSE